MPRAFKTIHQCKLLPCRGLAAKRLQVVLAVSVLAIAACNSQSTTTAATPSGIAPPNSQDEQSATSVSQDVVMSNKTKTNETSATATNNDKRAAPTTTTGAADRDAALLSCPRPAATVRSAEKLSQALAAAKPGTAIQLAAGTYSGNFSASVSGTAEKPIWLCGNKNTILSGDSTDKGYVFHLNKVQHWRVVGFSVRQGLKGVMADATVGTVIQGLSVTDIGDEAIHLRAASTDNVIRGNTISNTGKHTVKFGEGIYIGSAKSNWCKYSNCQPDRSDRNVIEGNTISRTTAESVDIKEGTHNGKLINNVFDGSGISAADSLIDVKGNGWLIEANRGMAAPGDGFQIHNILDDWGTKNIFRRNTIALGEPSAEAAKLKGRFGIASRPKLDNSVSCNNTVTGGEKTNIDCQ